MTVKTAGIGDILTNTAATGTGAVLGGVPGAVGGGALGGIGAMGLLSYLANRQGVVNDSQALQQFMANRAHWVPKAALGGAALGGTLGATMGGTLGLRASRATQRAADTRHDRMQEAHNRAMLQLLQNQQLYANRFNPTLATKVSADAEDALLERITESTGDKGQAIAIAKSKGWVKQSGKHLELTRKGKKPRDKAKKSRMNKQSAAYDNPFMKHLLPAAAGAVGGALIGGGGTALLNSTTEDESRKSSVLRNALIGALLGGAGNTAAAQLARNYQPAQAPAVPDIQTDATANPFIRLAPSKPLALPKQIEGLQPVLEEGKKQVSPLLDFLDSLESLEKGDPLPFRPGKQSAELEYSTSKEARFKLLTSLFKKAPATSNRVAAANSAIGGGATKQPGLLRKGYNAVWGNRGLGARTVVGTAAATGGFAGAGAGKAWWDSDTAKPKFENMASYGLDRKYENPALLTPDQARAQHRSYSPFGLVYNKVREARDPGYAAYRQALSQARQLNPEDMHASALRRVQNSGQSTMSFINDLRANRLQQRRNLVAELIEAQKAADTASKPSNIFNALSGTAEKDYNDAQNRVAKLRNMLSAMLAEQHSGF